MPEPKVINVLIGCIDMTRAPNRLVTVLGSCIGVVLWDPELSLAGMAHVLLPDSRGQQPEALPGKYADRAVPILLRALLDHGANKGRLRAKAAGGARMFRRVAAGGSGDVGAQNIAAIMAALASATVPILAEDFGGTRGRKVSFDPVDGRFSVETLEHSSAI